MFQTRHSLSQSKRMINSLMRQNGVQRLCAYVWLRIKRRPGDPKFVARGMAVGMAVNFIPGIGIHLPIGLATCYLLKADYIAFFVGSSLANFATLPFFWLMMYRVGAVVIGRLPQNDGHIAKLSWDLLVNNPLEVLLPMCVGGLILGVAASTISYYMTYYAVKTYRQQRAVRSSQKLEDIAKAAAYGMVEDLQSHEPKND
jgi:uncharacterized protein